MSVVSKIYTRLDTLVHEILKFGIVGACAFVVDVGLFNLMLAVDGTTSFTAKIVSVVVATFVAYAGNRYWTFRHRGGHGLSRETALFFALNAAALLIALACLGISQYVLGFTGALADNIAANVIGLGLGTLFRFWSYRRFVFPATAPALTPVPAAAAAPALVPVTAVARTDRKRAAVAA